MLRNEYAFHVPCERTNRMETASRSRTTDESLGIRLHEVNRQRAVERAIERLRHGLKADWHYLSQDDLANLRWMIGELWTVTARDEWDGLHFSKLEFEDTRRIVSHADRLRRHGTRRMATLDTVRSIVVGARGGEPGADPAFDGASFAY